MKFDICEGDHIRLRNGEIHGPVVLDGAFWRHGDSRWYQNGRAYSDNELHSLDIVATMSAQDAKHIKIAIDTTDMSFTPPQFEEWLADVRKVAPGITNKEIAKGIGRTDQWISNSLSRGVNHHSALALWFYLDTLQKNCNAEEKEPDNVQDQRKR